MFAKFDEIPAMTLQDIKETKVAGGIIMYFLVNASLPKPLDIATSNFADALVRKKAGICDSVLSTEV